ncbi:hypothetical protein NGRA_1939 [Nosema granulosis]|uniref:Uncharacterized protein n=1 Tax=Nosema granulosis TaxID=83296 RepID=A0A9P6H098_9MICR|nr:hypothetical protein NGRA_1939 [Nosema granulosis]
MLFFLFCATIENSVLNDTIQRGHFIKERIAIREFKKVLKASFDIFSVEFEFLNSTQAAYNMASAYFRVLEKNDINKFTSEISYYSDEFNSLKEFIKYSDKLIVIRYNFTYKKGSSHFCETMCYFNLSDRPTLSKRLNLNNKNLESYFERLISKAIINSKRLGISEGLIKEKINKIKYLNHPLKIFKKLDVTTSFIIKLAQENLSIFNSGDVKMVKKYLSIFQNLYFDFFYCGKDSLEEILIDKKKKEVMIKAVCDMLEDIIIITSFMDFTKERTNQVGLYVEQNSKNYTFTVANCYILKIFELEGNQPISKEIKVKLCASNNKKRDVKFFKDGSKLIIPLENIKYEEVAFIEVQLVGMDGSINQKTINLIKTVN